MTIYSSGIDNINLLEGKPKENTVKSAMKMEESTQLLAVTLTNLRSQIPHGLIGTVIRETTALSAPPDLQEVIKRLHIQSAPNSSSASTSLAWSSRGRWKGWRLRCCVKVSARMLENGRRASHQRSRWEKLPTGGKDSTQEQRALLSSYKTCVLSAWFSPPFFITVHFLQGTNINLKT